MQEDLKRRRSGRVAEEIRQRVLRGTYRPHSYLPGERHLAEEFDVSRDTISAALETLATDGLVVQARGRGTRVLPPLERLSKNLIGVVYVNSPSLAAEPAAILDGIRTTFRRLDYRFDLVPMAYRPSDYVPQTSSIRLEEIASLPERYGALLFLEGDPKSLPRILDFQRSGLPTVVANLEMDADVSATWVDHRKVMFQATKLMLALGHRRIAFIRRTGSNYFYDKAEAGYRQALESAGIAVDEKLVGIAAETASLSAYFLSREMLRASPPPTAIVAARDVLAHGACEAIQEAGLVVGRDVSVIGFDDISWPHDNPFLTTFREPCFEMGALAAEILAERIVKGARSVEKREIDAPLIIRRSASACLDTEGRPTVPEDVLLSFARPIPPP